MILVLLGLAGGVIGLSFADIDLAPPLPLKHRSAWTHGLPIPLAIMWLSGKYPEAWTFAGIFLLAYAFHLVLDMFPRHWRGSALINLYPVPACLPAPLSFLYLLAGVAGAVWLSARIMGFEARLVEFYQLVF